jgi:outer membrane protein TolC
MLEVGLGTLPDVLQAQASLAQAELDLVNDQGQVEISRGNLATAVGWGANEGFEIQEVDENFEPALLLENVDNIIDIALKARPDIAAALASVRQSEASIRSARSAMLPSLSTSGTLSQLYIWPGDGFFEGNADDDTNYQFALTLAVPIFHGFALRNAIREAEAELEASQALLKIQEQEVVSDVWDAYYNFQTSVQALAAAKKLFASSLESYNASLERYRSGVGDIIELLTAQATLASSRSETVQARTNIFVSYAQLVNAVGLNLPISADGQTVEIPEFDELNNTSTKEENKNEIK